MLNAQQSEFLMHESAVFGKPWYWQRTSGTMESTRSLAHVIMEMRDEIKKLETENKVLRGEIGQPSFGSEPVEPSPNVQGEAGDSPQHINLRRNVSAPALEGQYKENMVMTVRRYSVASHVHAPRSSVGAARASDGGVAARGTTVPSWGRLQQDVHRNNCNISSSLSPEEVVAPAKDKITTRRSLQEYVNKNRAKVKTVTFLLPVDDIYTSQPVLASPLLNKNSDEQDAIIETDS